MPRPPKLVKRCLFAFAVGFAGLAVVVIGLYAFENWRGRRAWEKYRAAAEARGETFDWKSVLPSPIADEDNFAAIPIFQEAAAAGMSARELKTPFTLPPLPKSAGSDPTGDPFQIIQWREHFVKMGWIEDATDDPARDVLQALERVEPWLQQLRDASSRPTFRFPVNWEDGASAKIPHVKILMDAQDCIALRARAYLALGDSASSFSEIRLGLRLCDAMKDEPFMVPSIVWAALLGKVSEVVWQGLAENSWSDAELNQLMSEFAALDAIARWQWAMRSERVAMNHMLDTILAGGPREFAESVAENAESPPTAKMVIVSHVYPRGWLYQNKAKIAQTIDAQLRRVSTKKHTIAPASAGEDYLSLAGQDPFAPLYYIWAKESMSIYQSVETVLLYSQAELNAVSIGCALELFRRRRGTFPETLTVAMDEDSKSISIDPCDGQPLRYRKTETGYRLWSVGANRKDDGGIPGTNPKPRHNPDWVWKIGD